MKRDKKYIEKLNELLSSYQVHYQNLRSLHWNIKGQSFFELHLKYEELYNRAQLIVDELAERILSIGASPMSQLKGYLKTSPINEIEVTKNGHDGVNYILTAQEDILKLEKILLNQSEELSDEGTNALMSDLIREKEKTNWMLKSWLDK
ncbi:MAG: DNA starvation/stationary phase protection protein [Crocinitomicaceae bacterium]|nr:DNA starvation/stationary phase protection protein [Crocinitomicaceae bacterium]MDG1658698.1 DNA starvation/stationary phase protection protein [Crocinitomicaceae bacterium]MDG2440229.1 DNA starvation/stationary phase protection protein [Crocinitomicaceae bacterium]